MEVRNISNTAFGKIEFANPAVKTAFNKKIASAKNFRTSRMGDLDSVSLCKNRQQFLKNAISEENKKHPNRLFVIDSLTKNNNEIFTVSIGNQTRKILGMNNKDKQSLFDFAVDLCKLF